MDTDNKDKQRQSQEADELEFTMEEREDSRLDSERDQEEDLNQGMQTGTHDASHPGIKWGPSYRVKKAAANANRSAEDKPKDPNAKP